MVSYGKLSANHHFLLIAFPISHIFMKSHFFIKKKTTFRHSIKTKEIFSIKFINFTTHFSHIS